MSSVIADNFSITSFNNQIKNQIGHLSKESEIPELRLKHLGKQMWGYRAVVDMVVGSRNGIISVFLRGGYK